MEFYLKLITKSDVDAVECMSIGVLPRHQADVSAQSSVHVTDVTSFAITMPIEVLEVIAAEYSTPNNP